MENFKSFGKKLSVPFFQGFTAITGPNGAGKSNIADAILFVLGPKSSKVMRAGRLPDLIFNGGKKHNVSIGLAGCTTLQKTGGSHNIQAPI